MPDYECACIDVDVDGSPGFHSATMRIARKQHKCCECGRVIEPREKYEYVTGKWARERSVYKTCPDCLSVREAFMCGSYYYTQVWEYVNEHLVEMGGKIASDCLLSLTKRARELACDMIQEIWDEDDWEKEGYPDA